MSVYVIIFVINSGAEFYQELNILSSNGDDPVNLTGYAATSMMRKHAESTVKTADFVVGITSAAKGTVSLGLGSTVTAVLKEGRYVYDLMLTTDMNTRSIVVEGMALVRSGISS